MADPGNAGAGFKERELLREFLSAYSCAASTKFAIEFGCLHAQCLFVKIGSPLYPDNAFTAMTTYVWA